MDGLSLLRLLFLVFLESSGLILLVPYFIVSDESTEEHVPWIWFLALAGYGLVTLALVRSTRSRRLDTASLETLAGSYKNQFFLGIAFAESAGLVGFVGVFLTGRLSSYLVGLAFALIGFAMMAPTRRNIERRQQEIMARGSALSLGEALMYASRPGRPQRGPVVSWPQ
jgi:hypothetical protein